MGGKAFAIFIKPAGNVDNQKLLDLFGYGDAVADREPGYLESAIAPADNYLYIARFNDVIAICVQDFPDRFYTEELTYIEQKLADFFPTGEILAVSLHSGKNYYGYALIKDGKKIRVKTGPGHNSAVSFEMGEPLPEEAVGEELIFSVTSRFTGLRMDQAGFLQIRAQGYQKEKEEKEETVESIRSWNRATKTTSFFQRYKYGIAALLVLLIYLLSSFCRK